MKNITNSHPILQKAQNSNQINNYVHYYQYCQINDKIRLLTERRLQMSMTRIQSQKSPNEIRYIKMSLLRIISEEFTFKGIRQQFHTYSKVYRFYEYIKRLRSNRQKKLQNFSPLIIIIQMMLRMFNDYIGLKQQITPAKGIPQSSSLASTLFSLAMIGIMLINATQNFGMNINNTSKISFRSFFNFQKLNKKAG